MAILFITSTRIGDAILSTGLLNALMERYPDDAVTVACGAPAVPIFKPIPRVERIHVIEKKRASGHWIDLWRACAGRRWRVVVDLRRSLIRWLLWAERRHGQPKDHAGGHRIELLARTLGIEPQAPRIWVGAGSRRAAERLVPDDAPLVAIAPGANWRGKIWPAERFAELMVRLTQVPGPLEGARVVVTGSADERPSAEPLIDALPEERVIDALGLSLPTTYALFEQCRLFVGNDSGLMHLAAASGRPTVGLFGPTRDDHYAPWGPNGLVVRTPESIPELIDRPDYDHRTTPSLMGGLSADTVLEAIGETWPCLASEPGG